VTIAEGATIEAPKGLSGVRSGGPILIGRLGGLGSVVSSPSGVRGGVPAEMHFGIFLGSQNPSGRQKNVFLSSVVRKINICLYDVFDVNVSNVSDCAKDVEAIIYEDLWGMGPFIRRGTAHLWGGAEPIRRHSWPRAWTAGSTHRPDRNAM